MSGDEPKFKWADIRRKTDGGACWIVFHNKVYDVTGWYDHPGGAVLFACAGLDVTDIFGAFHKQPNGYGSLMDQFYQGTLVEEDSSTQISSESKHHQHELVKAFRKLRADFVKMGLYKPVPWYYVYKFVSILLLGIVSSYLIMRSESSVTHFLGATILGLFLQQSAWIAHDLLHHQVFTNRIYADYWSLFWANVVEGYSVQWWKNKHAWHHAVTNVQDSSPGAQDGDPDLDTMPVLAWSLQQAQFYFAEGARNSKLVHFLVRYQS